MSIVITSIGGIVGKIVAVKADTIVVETSEDRVRVEFIKSAVGTVGTLEEQAAAAQRPARKSKKDNAAEEVVEPVVEEKSADKE